MRENISEERKAMKIISVASSASIIFRIIGKYRRRRNNQAWHLHIEIFLKSRRKCWKWKWNENISTSAWEIISWHRSYENSSRNHQHTARRRNEEEEEKEENQWLPKKNNQKSSIFCEEGNGNQENPLHRKWSYRRNQSSGGKVSIEAKVNERKISRRHQKKRATPRRRMAGASKINK